MRTAGLSAFEHSLDYATRKDFFSRMSQNPFFNGKTICWQVYDALAFLGINNHISEVKEGHIMPALSSLSPFQAYRAHAAKRSHEGKVRARRIVNLAADAIAQRVGSTDITDLTNEELKARYRQLMRA